MMVLNSLFSRRPVITSHYLNKDDKCSRFLLNINNLEISIPQLPFLKNETEDYFIGGNRDK